MRKPAVRLLHVTDTHTWAPGATDDFATGAELAAELAVLVAQESADAVVITGDLTDLGRPEDLAEFRAAMRSIVPIPVITLYAGHDGADPDPYQPQSTGYRTQLGPLFTRLRIGPATLLLYPETTADGRLAGIDAAAQQEADRWFDAAVAAAADSAVGPTVLVTHDPTCFHAAAKPAREQYDPAVERWPRGAVQLLLNGQYHTTRLQVRQALAMRYLLCETFCACVAP
eukprot:SAG22_NODE_1563_length_4114_cov_6.143711_3_plen_228_part_00